MILIKEEFVGGEKYARAMKIGGGDAIAMWVALKCYAARHPQSAGFIPDEDVDDLAGAPRRPRKALDALVECGRLVPGGHRGPGLVDPVEGGWRLHDYLDHSVSPEEDELRRVKARIKKARQREEKRRELEQLQDASRGEGAESRGGVVPLGVPPNVPPCPPGTCPPVPGDTLGTVPVAALAGARAPTPGRPRVPNPTQPNLKTPPPLVRRKLRDHRARAGDPTPLGLVLQPPAAHQQVPDPKAEHQRFASLYGLDLADITAQCSAAEGFGELAPAQQQQAIIRALVGAAAERERVGGAA